MIKYGTVIKCPNRFCSKNLFKLNADINIGDKLLADKLQSLDISPDQFPQLGGAMICPHCSSRFIIPPRKPNHVTKIFTENGWEHF